MIPMPVFFHAWWPASSNLRMRTPLNLCMSWGTRIFQGRYPRRFQPLSSLVPFDFGCPVTQSGGNARSAHRVILFCAAVEPSSRYGPQAFVTYCGALVFKLRTHSKKGLSEEPGSADYRSPKSRSKEARPHTAPVPTRR